MEHIKIEKLKEVLNDRSIKSTAKSSFNLKYKQKITKVWLTVNRACNFRCPWCYAESTGYSNEKQMDMQMAKAIVEFAAELEADEVNIIGGEPLFYPEIDELISYINSKGMKSSIVTNGYKFADKQFFSKIEKSNLTTMGFSIKGFDKVSYKNNTKIDAFDEIQKAIENIKNSKIGGIYTVVVTEDVLDRLEDVARIVSKDKNKKLLLILCGPVFNRNGYVENDFILNPNRVIKGIMDKYDKIDEILDGRLLIEQSLPLCLWEKEFINKLERKKQIKSGCHVYRHSGVIFNTKGEVIVCNSLTDFPIGKFGVDFSNRREFEEFWTSDKIRKLYENIYKYPTEKCENCAEFSNCLGGCPLKWFTYDTKILDF